MPDEAPRGYRVPPPLSEKSRATIRFVVAAIALAIFAAVWMLTAALATHWRVLLSVLVAGPLLLVPDLLRHSSAPPRGFEPRRWDDPD